MICLMPLKAIAAGQASLTLGQAVALVLENNPQLQAADFDARAAAERIRQQSQGTPWKLGLDLDRFAGSGEADGTRNLETTLSLSRVMELGNQAELRGKVARHSVGLLRHEQDAQRLDLLAEAAKRFIAVARIQEERKLARQQLVVMQKTLKDVERRSEAGNAKPGELSRSRIGLARAELALEGTEHRLANAIRQLAVMWGEFQPGFQSVSANLWRLQAVPSYESLERALSRNPALAGLATAERLAEARLRLARASRRPDIDISAGLHHYNETDDVGLMLSLKVPLGADKRNRPYEAEVLALAEREPLLAKDKRLALRATLFGLHQELMHERHRHKTLMGRIIPAAEQALADYTRGYSAGRYSLLELTQAQEILLQARMEALDAAVAHHENHIQLDRLVGAGPSAGVSP
ncbi:MAG: TolC family protein [Gammaproteobacteria bacterium]|nr:TolC family protein [Gammaproteobacteria bacterium]MBU1654502.1 TolC family protein [Gammaproteobacteria bacterium]MBU1961320.1 TolC family protein [Gammaproteobacteria bacterium]